jgi:hypothetical protein
LQIVGDYKQGIAVRVLAEEHKLSEPGIYNILRTAKAQ